VFPAVHDRMLGKDTATAVADLADPGGDGSGRGGEDEDQHG
jgi:hypothetical protein